MIPNPRAQKNRRNEVSAADCLIPFPVRSRLRCPRCGAARQAGSDGYLCESTDQVQSQACEKLAHVRESKVLVTETNQILRKFGFGAIANLRMVR